MALFNTLKVERANFTENSVECTVYFVGDPHIELRFQEPGKFLRRKLKYGFDDIKTLEILTQDNAKNVSAAVGWGLLGTVVAGPIGLVAGGLLGLKKDDIVCVLRFHDDKTLLVRTTTKVFNRLDAIVAGGKLLGPEVSEHANQPFRELTGSEPQNDMGPTSVADELLQLKQLRDEGVLTEEEFAQQKAKILG